VGRVNAALTSARAIEARETEVDSLGDSDAEQSELRRKVLEARPAALTVILIEHHRHAERAAHFAHGHRARRLA